MTRPEHRARPPQTASLPLAAQLHSLVTWAADRRASAAGAFNLKGYTMTDTPISRRAFVRGSALTAGGAALAVGPAGALAKKKAHPAGFGPVPALGSLGAGPAEQFHVGVLVEVGDPL